MAMVEARNYYEAAKSNAWKVVMQEELTMIKKNHTWKLVHRPEKRNVIQVKWIYKLKTNPNGSIHKHKARLVVKDFAQQQGIDFSDILAPAPKAWYSRINDHLCGLGYTRSPNEYTLYIMKNESGLAVVSLYVDDLLVTGSNPGELDQFKSAMQTKFEVTDLGLMTYFLGMEINQSAGGIFVCQQKYTAEILMEFGMENCKPVDTPLVPNLKLSKQDGAKRLDEGKYKSLVGCLLYYTVARPNLMFIASYLSKFMSNPSELHFKVAKRVLRYVRGTTMLGIWFRKSESLKLLGYTDSDWGGSLDDAKSTYGYVFYMNQGAICWLSRKQETMA
ncbi:uncharacterized protein LOC116119932 [Pistacia vera]|uniref:uncharacterized protein LOC116119932 n=1 Tax=Pistacia vera TaxID=55513 RepID=UPI0012636838|nr:uncharacterized protein LOC116119932 [Pistacia vera]